MYINGCFTLCSAQARDLEAERLREAPERGAGDAAREGWWADPSNKCGYCETALEHALGDAANDECKSVRLDQRNRTFAYVLGLLKMGHG